MDKVEWFIVVLAIVFGIFFIIFVASPQVQKTIDNQNKIDHPDLYCQKMAFNENTTPVWCQEVNNTWTFDQGIYDSVHHV